MEQEPLAGPPVLDYAGPALVMKRRGWWLWGAFTFGIYFFEDLYGARLTGWPVAYDYVLMVLVPVGAIVMAIKTSVPGWAIGLYGVLSAYAFLLGNLGDNNLYLRLSLRADWRNFIFEFLLRWCVLMFGSWLICRVSVYLRRRPISQ